ncbi:MAG: hypothetical protein ACI80V_000397 [Rhodothermales bacterium]|jgi:hypothetical protein
MRLYLPLVLLVFLVVSGCDEAGMTASEMQDPGDAQSDATYRSGTFTPTQGLGKTAQGTATLSTLSDGTLRVDFSEDFSVTHGPRLFVLLSNAEFPTDDAVELGMFLRPAGGQTYAVPDSLSLDSYTHVLVHCIPYGVTFAYARLR